MSIKEIGQKSKSIGATLEKREVFTMLLLILVAVASFGLGRLSASNTAKGGIRLQEPLTGKLEGNTGVSDTTGVVPLGAAVGTMGTTQGKFVASKSGTKYHYPWCSGAKRIKEENKVWFNTVEEARKAGYTPAANCPGLE